MPSIYPSFFTAPEFPLPEPTSFNSSSTPLCAPWAGPPGPLGLTAAFSDVRAEATSAAIRRKVRILSALMKGVGLLEGKGEKE